MRGKSFRDRPQIFLRRGRCRRSGHKSFRKALHVRQRNVGTPFVNDGTPFGPPVPADYKPPAAAPVKHSGLELARANIDTPIEKIAMERGGQKAVDQVSSMAIGQTPRQLMQSYGGLFMSRAEPLFSSLGITRSDFEKALTMPQTKQDLKMRFGEGGGFGPYPAYAGPEAALGGGFPDFRQSTNIEDRRGMPDAMPGVPGGMPSSQNLLGYTPQQWSAEDYPASFNERFAGRRRRRSRPAYARRAREPDRQRLISCSRARPAREPARRSRSARRSRPTSATTRKKACSWQPGCIRKTRTVRAAVGPFLKPC